MSTTIERRPVEDLGTERATNEPQCADSVHPLVYKAMIGFAAVMIVATATFWLGGQPTMDVLLFAVVLIVIAVAIPVGLARIGRRRDAPIERGAEGSFSDWRQRDLSVWRGRVRGRDAAIEMLLPIAAVALGMLVFAIVAGIVLP